MIQSDERRAIAILEKNLSMPETTDQIADALATLADVYILMKKYVGDEW